MTDTDTIILSSLLGGGLYGGARLLHNNLDKIDQFNAPGEQHGVSGNKITIKLPRKQQPMAPAPMEEGLPMGMPAQVKQATVDGAGVAGGVAALLASFYGANKLHDTFQRKQQSKDLQKAHDDYQAALQQLQNNKVASSTPVVDAVCQAIANSLDKHATSPMGAVADFGKSVAFGNLGGTTDSWGQGAPIKYDMGLFPGSGAAGNWAWSNIGLPVAAIGSTYGAMKFLADRTKRKREEDAAARSQVPTEVVIDQNG